VTILFLLGASWLSPAARPVAHATPVSGDRDGARLVAQSAGPAGRPPNDRLFKYQWHLRAIQIPEAWAVSRGEGATVAVLDTGVAYEDRGTYRRAPDLAGTRFVRGWDFVDGDAHPDDVLPAHRRGDLLPGRQSHGTHIAGIIAQTTDNRIGGAGVAPKAAIMPIRVLKPDATGSGRNIARGLRFAADHGADVANVSIAGRSGSRVLRDAIAYAGSKGVVVVASAGNEGRSSVSFPAAYRDVVAVGALSRDKTRAYYSNYGKALDLVAPGGDREAYESGTGPGDGVLQQTLKGEPSTFCYCFMASTSAAAAQVSGVAALLVGSRRVGGPAEIRSALLSSAMDLGLRGRDPEYGAGLVQASSALSGTEASASRPSTAAHPQSSPLPVLGWLALSMAGAGLLGFAALSLRRRSRRSDARRPG
jgi:serine protease